MGSEFEFVRWRLERLLLVSYLGAYFPLSGSCKRRKVKVKEEKEEEETVNDVVYLGRKRIKISPFPVAAAAPTELSA